MQEFRKSKNNRLIVIGILLVIAIVIYFII